MQYICVCVCACVNICAISVCARVCNRTWVYRPMNNTICISVCMWDYAVNGRCPTISSNSTRFDMYFTLCVCVCVCVFTTISNMDIFANVLVELTFPQPTNQTYELNDFFSQKSSFLTRRALQYFKSVYTLYGIPLMTKRLFLSSIVIIMNSDVAYPCCQIFYRTDSC